jgi:WD40 repeat protein
MHLINFLFSFYCTTKMNLFKFSWQPSYCLQEYTAHTSAVMSLDFHPKKTDLFCFCDNDNEISYWNINPFSCTRISKVGPFVLLLIHISITEAALDYLLILIFYCLAQGGMAQVRFQPRIGHMLAAASDKVVSIFDVETDRKTYSFQVWNT